MYQRGWSVRAMLPLFLPGKEFDMSKDASVDNPVEATGRRTRKKYSAEDKIRIVLEGLRSEVSVARLCQREGIPSNLYYRWSKEFLEAGKLRLKGGPSREGLSREVAELRSENEQLKQLAAELMLTNRRLKRSLTGSTFEEPDS